MKSVRTRMSALAVAGATALALMAPATGGAGASNNQSTHQSAAMTAPAHRPVLSSDLGEARSKIFGSWGTDRKVRGWFTPRRVRVVEGQLMAVGTLHGVLLRPNGSVRGEEDKAVTVPVRSIQGVPMSGRAQQLPGCDILNLVLGPLDLNLLGLEVHLNRVVLDIVATPGPGNLLGNLLCAVAGLLDNTGVLTEIRQILSAILAALRL